MTYFHPRDFDAELPLIPDLSFSRKFKSYAGPNNCRSKLETWVNDFYFFDFKEACETIEWEKLSRVII